MDSRRRPILVVEDSLDDLDTIAQAARSMGVENPLVHAPNAEVARRLLVDRAEDFAFVILDNNLPGMDGCDFLGEIRGAPACRGLPVVVFTTSVSSRERRAFYEAGANAYHVKSVRYDECLSTLTAVFRYWLSVAALPEPSHEST